MRPLMLILVFCFTYSFGQNKVPSITNISAVIDPVKKQMIVSYDLDDNEKDQIEITFKASNDKGQTYLVSTAGAKGDLGYPVNSGRKKRIIWDYPDTLNYVQSYKIKIIANDRKEINIQELVDQVDSVNMMNDLKKIYGIRSHENENSFKHLAEVRALIAKRFVKEGLYTYYLKKTINKITFQNVLGRLAGHEDEGITYILCAHMDTEKRSPGADDNGSGVVGMLEASRILSKYNFKHSIKFIAFDGEEVGHVGSQIYLYYKGIKDYEKLEGVINYDMIGFYSTKANSQRVPKDGFEIIFADAIKEVAANKYRGDFVVNTSNSYSKELGIKFSSSAKKYVPSLKVISLVAPARGDATPELTASDHFQFWKAGYKALHIGDGGETRNIHLDTKRDYIETINYTFISNIVKATIGMLAELGEIQHSSIGISDVSVATPAAK